LIPSDFIPVFCLIKKIAPLIKFLATSASRISKIIVLNTLNFSFTHLF
jgi:hypothetical protein